MKEDDLQTLGTANRTALNYVPLGLHGHLVNPQLTQANIARLIDQDPLRRPIAGSIAVSTISNWKSSNLRVLSEFMNSEKLSDVAMTKVLRLIPAMNANEPIPTKVSQIHEAEADITQAWGLKTLTCPIPQPTGDNGDRVMEYNNYALVMYDVMEIAIQILNVWEHIDQRHFQFQPLYKTDSDDYVHPEHEASRKVCVSLSVCTFSIPHGACQCFRVIGRKQCACVHDMYVICT